MRSAWSPPSRAARAVARSVWVASSTAQPARSTCWSTSALSTWPAAKNRRTASATPAGPPASEAAAGGVVPAPRRRCREVERGRSQVQRQRGSGPGAQGQRLRRGRAGGVTDSSASRQLAAELPGRDSCGTGMPASSSSRAAVTPARQRRVTSAVRTSPPVPGSSSAPVWARPWARRSARASPRGAGSERDHVVDAGPGSTSVPPRGSVPSSDPAGTSALVRSNRSPGSSPASSSIAIGIFLGQTAQARHQHRRGCACDHRRGGVPAAVARRAGGWILGDDGVRLHLARLLLGDLEGQATLTRRRAPRHRSGGPSRPAPVPVRGRAETT